MTPSLHRVLENRTLDQGCRKKWSNLEEIGIYVCVPKSGLRPLEGAAICVFNKTCPCNLSHFRTTSPSVGQSLFLHNTILLRPCSWMNAWMMVGGGQVGELESFTILSCKHTQSLRFKWGSSPNSCDSILLFLSITFLNVPYYLKMTHSEADEQIIVSSWKPKESIRRMIYTYTPIYTCAWGCMCQCWRDVMR